MDVAWQTMCIAHAVQGGVIVNPIQDVTHHTCTVLIPQRSSNHPLRSCSQMQALVMTSLVRAEAIYLQQAAAKAFCADTLCTCCSTDVGVSRSIPSITSSSESLPSSCQGGCRCPGGIVSTESFIRICCCSAQRSDAAKRSAWRVLKECRQRGYHM